MSEQFEIFLKEQMQLPYMKNLQAFIRKQRETIEVYPPAPFVLHAIKTCDYNCLKVVILGPEPYNAPGMDMGIAYNSLTQQTPRELLEIQREIRRTEYPYPFTPNTMLFKTSNLTQWVEQEVLLINSILTVEREKPGSHRGQGWEQFTEALLKKLNKHHYRLVFMLWGKDNWDYADLLDPERHLILKAPAPGTGKFYGCSHFAKCNEFLMQSVNSYGWMRGPINWHLLK